MPEDIFDLVFLGLGIDAFIGRHLGDDLNDALGIIVFIGLYRAAGGIGKGQAESFIFKGKGNKTAGLKIGFVNVGPGGDHPDDLAPDYAFGQGRVFNLFVRLLLAPDLRDTQCGFKLFSAQAAEAVFRLARMDGFVFDVEALFLAQRHGLRVAEVPVTWRNDAASRVGLLKGFQAFPDLLGIRVNDWRGRYRQPNTDNC